MGNENVTLTAQRGDTNLLKDAHLGSLVFKEYNPKFEKYPLVARVIAAGAVVRGEIPDHSVVAGVPGRVVRRWTREDGWQPPFTNPIEVVEGWPVGVPPEG